MDEIFQYSDIKNYLLEFLISLSGEKFCKSLEIVDEYWGLKKLFSLKLNIPLMYRVRKNINISLE